MIFQPNRLGCLRIGLAAMLVVFALGFGTTMRGQTENSLPAVISASVPFYPPIARIAHVTGEVTLRISTDGYRVSAVSIESGPAMLASAAEENVKTWRFEKHKPAQLEITFHYNLSYGGCDAHCNCDSPGHDIVLLRLPSDVEVIAKTLPTCDPAAEIKR